MIKPNDTITYASKRCTAFFKLSLKINSRPKTFFYLNVPITWLTYLSQTLKAHVVFFNTNIKDEILK